MESPLLDPKIQQFIFENTNADLAKLALSRNPFPQVPMRVLLNQVAARSKCRDKLPAWFSSQNIIYPLLVSIEQASSEKTAQYKSGLIAGNSLIDLTGGFGVDDYYFSRVFDEVIHCESNTGLSDIAKHNFDVLGTGNIRCISGDSRIVLKGLDRKFDWIYIDPSRRNDTKGKVFLLKDCEPDVLEMLDFYFRFSNKLLIKTSPMLDITAGRAALLFVRNIHIIGVDNEVKELLWEVENNYAGKVTIKTVNLHHNKRDRFDFEIDSTADPNFSVPQKYLYEPNAAIMKSGGFNAVSQTFGLPKLHEHSHLYTSGKRIEFPGRIFSIDSVLPYTRSAMQTIENSSANVTVRNFPESVETIRKKWRIRDGGDRFCFFTTGPGNDKIVLLCSKI